MPLNKETKSNQTNGFKYCYVSLEIQLSISHLVSNSSISPRDRTLSGATTPGKSAPRSDGNERMLHIPQIFKTGASQLNFLTSYPGHSLGEYNPVQECSRCILDPLLTELCGDKDKEINNTVNECNKQHKSITRTGMTGQAK